VRAVSGDGSNPPLQNGWQRAIRFTCSQPPRAAPYRSMASSPYAEQVGSNRQTGGLSGEIPFR
jgi:hypothetical protein